MACDPTLLQKNLTDARSAYHNLRTGKMARVVVDQNGERVEFVAANATALYNYIQQLEGELAACLGTAATVSVPRGPAQFFF